MTGFNLNEEQVERMWKLGQDVSQIVGFTDWRTDSPPRVGWYNVRFKGAKIARRRWWNGVCFSKPVIIGLHDNVEANTLAAEPSTYRNEYFEWQGLAWNGIPL